MDEAQLRFFHRVFRIDREALRDADGVLRNFSAAFHEARFDREVERLVSEAAQHALGPGDRGLLERGLAEHLEDGSLAADANRGLRQGDAERHQCLIDAEFFAALFEFRESTARHHTVLGAKRTGQRAALEASIHALKQSVFGFVDSRADDFLADDVFDQRHSHGFTGAAERRLGASCQHGSTARDERERNSFDSRRANLTRGECGLGNEPVERGLFEEFSELLNAGHLQLSVALSHLRVEQVRTFTALVTGDGIHKRVEVRRVGFHPVLGGCDTTRDGAAKTAGASRRGLVLRLIDDRRERALFVERGQALQDRGLRAGLRGSLRLRSEPFKRLCSQHARRRGGRARVAAQEPDRAGRGGRSTFSRPLFEALLIALHQRSVFRQHAELAGVIRVEVFGRSYAPRGGLKLFSGRCCGTPVDLTNPQVGKLTGRHIVAAAVELDLLGANHVHRLGVRVTQKLQRTTSALLVSEVQFAGGDSATEGLLKLGLVTQHKARRSVSGLVEVHAVGFGGQPEFRAGLFHELERAARRRRRVDEVLAIVALDLRDLGQHARGEIPVLLFGSFDSSVELGFSRQGGIS